jgi:hypothetical protein
LLGERHGLLRLVAATEAGEGASLGGCGQSRFVAGHVG